MEAKTSNSVREYINHHYRGGLIGISDLAEYCHILEGEIYKTLVDMQSQGELKIIKRYFCPEFHRIEVNASELSSYCEKCDFTYPNEQIEVSIYIEPIDVKVPR